MSKYPDRSDSPAFYDPEHPDNRMPQARRASYWVEVLCQDHYVHGWGGLAHDREQAEDLAWKDAEFWGERPIEIVSCEVQS